jgi:hypothetical protein
MSPNWHRIQGSCAKQDKEFLRSTEFFCLEACHVPAEYQAPDTLPIPTGGAASAGVERTIFFYVKNVTFKNCNAGI